MTSTAAPARQDRAAQARPETPQGDSAEPTIESTSTTQVNPYRHFACRLVARQQVSPSFVRITLAGEHLGSVSDVLGDQRVKLVMGEPAALDHLCDCDDWFASWRALPDEVRPTVRTYTLTAVRPDAEGNGEVDIDVVVHPGSHGPGSDLAVEGALGTHVGLLAADRTRAGYRDSGIGWHPGNARQVMLVGDETALPAIANLLAGLDADVTGEALIEVPLAADRRRLAAPDGVRVRWFARELGRFALDALPHIACPPLELVDSEPLWSEGEGSDWYLWAAGESGWVRRIRAITRASGRPASQMSLMGYWKQGVALG